MATKTRKQARFAELEYLYDDEVGPIESRIMDQVEAIETITELRQWLAGRPASISIWEA